MLITLQSTVDDDASNFSNYFKETIIIQPDSEIAFVNIGYTFVNDSGGDRESQIMLVNLDDFEIKSVCRDGGVQKAIASIPYGEEVQNGDKFEGEVYHESKVLMYQPLGNKHVINHNQLRVRLTDGAGNPLTLLEGITNLTIDVRPRAK